MDSSTTKADQSSHRWVQFKHGQGTEIGRLLRATRHVAVFETYASSGALHVSQVLNCFSIMVRERAVYSGRAVVQHLIDTGVGAIGKVSLGDNWQPGELKGITERLPTLQADFKDLHQVWKRSTQLLPEYKLVLSDLQTFLWDLRSWLDDMEAGLESATGLEGDEKQRAIVMELAPTVGRTLDGLIERFESLVGRLPEDAHPAHKAFLQRQLHPLILCSPFAHRAYTKPLGYAGDYEVVRMIAAEPCVGSSLFAKLLNVWFLGQAPAQAHRNRLSMLLKHIRNESIRVSRWKRSPRIVSVACGPALEVVQLLEEPCLGCEPQFTLLDFNEETLDYVSSSVAEACRRHGRHAVVRTMRKSVSELLKGRLRSKGLRMLDGSDLVYCAGIFDYLTDDVCRLLTEVLYGLLSPGGLLLVTNVDASLNSWRGFRYSMEYMLEWNLLFRTGQRLEELGLAAASGAAECRLEADLTGVNNFLMLRKPGKEHVPGTQHESMEGGGTGCGE